MGDEGVLSAARVCRMVLVPVLPGPLGIRAATRFLQTLMLTRGFRTGRVSAP